VRTLAPLLGSLNGKCQSCTVEWCRNLRACRAKDGASPRAASLEHGAARRGPAGGAQLLLGGALRAALPSAAELPGYETRIAVVWGERWCTVPLCKI
jgi:hypothetical protein